MSEGTQRIVGHVTNARFLTIGSDKQVLAGTLNGKTFYSEPIIELDGNIIRTANGSFRYSRNLH
ncbi:hypothetical protein [Rhizobium phage RHph_X66]|nr:hypothetical protein [Rhizobium phage RHph_X66]